MAWPHIMRRNRSVPSKRRANLRILTKQRAFKRRMRINFYRTLHQYEKAGRSKKRALQSMRDTYSSYLTVRQRIGNWLYQRFGGRKKLAFRPVPAIVAEEALTKVDQPLHEALADWLPESELAVLEAGEVSGDPVQSLDMAKRLVERQTRMWGSLVSGFSYPLLLIAGVMAVLYGLAGELPNMNVSGVSGFSPIAAFVIGAAEFVYVYWFISICGPIALIAVAILSLPRWTGRGRILADHIAPWSYYRRIHGAMFLFSYCVLQKSGSPVLKSLAVLARSANPYLKSRIHAAMYGVRQGYKVGQALRLAGHNFPDREALPVLEDIGSLQGSADALIEYAEGWLEDTVKLIEQISKRFNAFAKTWIIIWIALIAVTLLEIIQHSYK